MRPGARNREGILLNLSSNIFDKGCGVRGITASLTKRSYQPKIAHLYSLPNTINTTNP